jgi:hypothetical protein
MAKSAQIDGFGCARELQAALIADGWRTPDTYGNHYESPKSEPSVYLFVLFKDDMFKRARVAYVGMTIDTIRRWSGHEILPQLDQAGRWTQKWFRPVSRDDLRKVEAVYIAQHNPPWNIIGKRRGITT